jgi:hypothetical protein
VTAGTSDVAVRNRDQGGDDSSEGTRSQYRVSEIADTTQTKSSVETDEPVRQHDSRARSDHSPIATRVIGEDRTVLSQNGVMTEWTGINGNSEEVTCEDQLTVPFCGTDACIHTQLIEEETEWITAKTAVQLPTEETKPVHLVAEQITNEAGVAVAVAESFKDISSLVGARNSPPSITRTSPSDEATFREALGVLLGRATANGVQTSNRSWKCESERTGDRWDVEIAKRYGSE